jgi:hypothetical protein
MSSISACSNKDEHKRRASDPFPSQRGLNLYRSFCLDIEGEKSPT